MMFNGMRVIVNPLLQADHIGHWFVNPPPAKNRSRRIWKKLRYGKRRAAVRRMEEHKAVVIGGALVVHPAAWAAMQRAAR